MADRTFNSVDARLYDEPKLSKRSRVILAKVVAKCPNPYGIYDPTIEFVCLDWFDGVFGAISADDLAGYFEELVARGKVTRFREGDCLWLTKKFKREIPAIRNPNQVKAAVQFFDNYPEVKAAFWETHGEQFVKKANQFTDLRGWLLTNWPEGRNWLLTSSQPIPSDSDSDSEADSNTSTVGKTNSENKTKTSVRGGRSSASDDADAPPSASGKKAEESKWVESAAKFADFIDSKCKEHNYLPLPSTNRTVKAAGQLRLLHKEIDLRVVWAALEWSWTHSFEDGTIYGTQLTSIVNWRQRARSNNEPKIANCVRRYKAQKANEEKKQPAQYNDRSEVTRV